MKDSDPTPAGHGDVGEFGFIENVKRRPGPFRSTGQSGSAGVIPPAMSTRVPGAGGIRSRQGAWFPAMSPVTMRGEM